MKIQKTILITGNHHTPAIELIHQLKNDPHCNWQIIYVSELLPHETHLHRYIIPDKSITFINLKSTKFDRRQPIKSLLSLPKLLISVAQSFTIIKKNQPDIVVSFGGYVSVPIIFTSWFNKIPSITHEQTVTNSLTTKINALFATKVALSFDNQRQRSQLPKSKVVVTGNLLRHEIFDHKNSHLDQLISKNKPLIYVTGGNQGSRAINQLVSKIIPQLSQYHIIHQVGPTDYPHFSDKNRKNYTPVEYVTAKDIGWIFHHAKLIISRSGANICQEIATFGIPAILIPLPHTQQDEQNQNASWLQSLQPEITKIVQQDDLSPSIVQLIDVLSVQPRANSSFSTKGNLLLQLIHELDK